MKRTNYSRVGALVCALFAAAPALYADCTVYDYSGFRGAARSLSPGERVGNLGTTWDNRLSSAEMTENCSLTLYSDPNFHGDSKTLRTSASYIGSLWDNQASSAICSCTRPAHFEHRHDWRERPWRRHSEWNDDRPQPKYCRLYRESNFLGGELALEAGNSYNSLGYGMNDQASSVKVPRGCSLTVYSHEGLDGRSKIFLEGDYNFVGEPWNDRVSSAECSCTD